MELEGHFLDKRAFWEHHNYYEKEYKINEENLPTSLPPILFKGNNKCVCFEINQDKTINNSYYIGIDWLIEGKKAVYVQSKINKDSNEQIDYLAMVNHAINHPEVFEHTKDLYEIKWDKPQIYIQQKQDLLTPLLILQFLQVVKTIVKKGLKKSYYKVENNLNSKVKGKILTAKNVKLNIVKGGIIKTYCSYDEFGFNGIENRLIKKTLIFIQRYLPANKSMWSGVPLGDIFNYIMPLFSNISEEVNIKDCKHLKINSFFKEYKIAINLAKQILQRYGYNINNVFNINLKTPPFWIDMSKLFELYVLGLLKDKYKGANEIAYHFKTHGNELDYIINIPEYKTVVDAKYKIRYKSGVDHEDIRQVSGYARLKKVQSFLNFKEPKLIDCVIIYPESELNKNNEPITIDLQNTHEINDYVCVSKYGVKLPAIKEWEAPLYQ